MHSNNAGPDSTPFDGDTVADSSQANPGEDISSSRLEMGKHVRHYICNIFCPYGATAKYNSPILTKVACRIYLWCS